MIFVNFDKKKEELYEILIKNKIPIPKLIKKNN